MATCPTCRKQYPDSVSVCDADGARLLPDEAFRSVDKDLSAGQAVGEYVIEAKLGEGGFGAVYRAAHPLIGKKVAIKVLSREFSSKPDIVARFIDEARSVNQIRHRGIIDIFAFGSLPDGRHYFVMELLEGKPLDAFIHERQRLTPNEAIPILRGVARAVDAAHAAGIAHRDLKPDNVYLVADEDGGTRTKLLDFGVAKLLDERSGPKTQTGTPIGTPQYMSPEQSRGIDVDYRADVYSFGVMAYEMLTGKLPFEGAAVMDILVKQISEAPKKPSEVCPELSPAFDAPILRMMEKAPGNRPVSLGAAVDELAQAAGTAGIDVGISVPSLPMESGAHSTLATARTVASSPATLVGSASEIGPSTKRRTAPIVAGIAVLALGAGAFGMWSKSHKSGDVAASSSVAASSAPASATTASSSAAAIATEKPSAATVSVTFEVTPANAEVFSGADRLGSAPGPLQLPKGTTKVLLTLKAPGHTPRDVDVDVSRDVVVSASLTPIAAATAKTTATAAATTHKTSSDLENPF